METVKEGLYLMVGLISLIYICYMIAAIFMRRILPSFMRDWDWKYIAAIAVVGLTGFGAVLGVVEPEEYQLEREIEAKVQAEIKAAERNARDRAEAQERQEHQAAAERQKPRTPGGQSMERIIVPSDSSSEYWYFSLNKKGNRTIEVSTKRIGKTGQTSYVKRIIDCGNSRFSYLKDANSWNEYLNQQEMTVDWSGFVEGSISFWVAHDTCQAAGYL